MTRKNEPAQTIEDLRNRYDALSTERVRLQTQKERAETDLSKIKQQARDEFGTDDLDKLQSMLSEMKLKNEAEKSEYQKRLDEIELKLLKIDQSFEEVVE